MELNVLPAEYDVLEMRESPEFWDEPGASTFRSNLGEETNVVVLKRLKNNEISAIHDGIHYNITYSNDVAAAEAVDRLRTTFTFPPTEAAHKVATRMRQLSTEDQEAIAISQAVSSGSHQIPRSSGSQLQDISKEPSWIGWLLLVGGMAIFGAIIYGYITYVFR